MRKKLATIMASVALMLGVGVGVAPNALAYGPSYCNASTCSLSNSANTGGIYFEMPRYTPVTMLCWTDSQWWNGTNRWFKVDSQYGRGYMIATQVAKQTVVGRC
jgi:hypothetical protein